MSKHSAVAFPSPQAASAAPLTAVLRQGAKRLLAQAIEAEVQTLLACDADVRDEQGRQAVVRHGYLPQREVQTGIGAVSVHVPRVRERSGQGIRFHASVLPPYRGRSRSVEELLPWLYLQGVSTGDFSEALASLLGPDAPGLSASTIGRLKETWQDELKSWQHRDLSAKRYVYFWVDGIDFEVRLEEAKPCMWVIMGADATGKKELVGLWDGYREREPSWKELLLDLKPHGLPHGPSLAIGDGALGFWKAMRQVYGETRRQRCWVHKTANVLNYLPKGKQKPAKQHLHEIWMAASRQEAEKALDYLVWAYGAKYPKAGECLSKDRDVLLTFYDFAAAHWVHIRTTNPLESTFATVRLRTGKTRGCLSRDTAFTMVFTPLGRLSDSDLAS